MRVYIGYDPRDELAFRACVSSLREHSSIDLNIYPLKDYELRRLGIYSRPYSVEASGQKIDGIENRPFSTEFSFTRFAIPVFDESDDWVMFCDADFLWREDVRKLLDELSNSNYLMCVKHKYEPDEKVKFDGMSQKKYWRKNWSSLMMMRPARLPVTKELLNTADGMFLHQFQFVKDGGKIGGLSNKWNWLEGWPNNDVKPAAVHYTRGTPDMLAEKLPFAGEWWEAVRKWKPSMNYHGISDLCMS